MGMLGHPSRGFRRDRYSLPLDELRDMSEAIFAAADVPLRFPDPRILIHAIGGRTLPVFEPVWCDLVGETIRYEWTNSQRERGLALHYGLARVALRRWAPHARSLDAWRLTAFNLVPVDVSPG